MEKSLSNKYPQIAAEWHPTKNGEHTAEEIHYRSKERVWWKCPEAEDHEWEVAVVSRTATKSGCPFCKGTRSPRSKSLGVVYPKLAEEWHPIKNGDQTPYDISAHNGKKVWWLCPKGHTYDMKLSNRVYHNHNCPYCGNRRVNGENNLAKQNPALAGEWHPEYNGDVTPADRTPKSSKKAWWLCPNGVLAEHAWETTISNRAKGKGCPYCAGRLVHPDNCFANHYPDKAKEWHPHLNGELTPNDVTSRSTKKVWWKCEHGHEWETTPVSRAKGAGCLVCTNQIAGGTNTLAYANPNLAAEWHPTYNGELTPDDVIANSSHKRWWKCEKNHEWEATVHSRNAGNKCPYCRGFYTTEENALATIAPRLVHEWHPTHNGELTPENVSYATHEKVWWKCQYGHEWEANVWNRVNGNRCPDCSSGMSTSYPEQLLFHMLKPFFKDVTNRERVNGEEVDVYVPSLPLAIEYDGAFYHGESLRKREDEKNKALYEAGVPLIRIREKRRAEGTALLSETYGCFNIVRENSYSDASFQLVMEELLQWIEKEHNLTLDREKVPHANAVVSEVAERLRTQGVEKNLAVTKPDIAKEWHPTLNGTVEPIHYSFGSGQKVWWLCPNGHPYIAGIGKRTNGTNCPHCSDKIRKQNSLAAYYPVLAKEWDAEKNEKKATTTSSYDTREYSWVCDQGHEWEASPLERTQHGEGCPEC
ncbi:hypothetical protein IMZ31_21995 (plasmid) [Pontibacillus sp. ALD_SL1]|uniref:zinc-ribbon domain-containing protein n=1 Tax=Pontibacillus sp. ALD_SL1 TaxID=2777185 RepID=UPI001A9744FC|nr:zinc-ribbon domain-containing protein [Pontibacillus sp. ALD_SL1]QST02126.1 hypothetical protein IMZ31_21995 [Pontibacillus sp. ALD_SL1]